MSVYLTIFTVIAVLLKLNIDRKINDEIGNFYNGSSSIEN